MAGNPDAANSATRPTARPSSPAAHAAPVSASATDKRATCRQRCIGQRYHRQGGTKQRRLGGERQNQALAATRLPARRTRPRAHGNAVTTNHELLSLYLDRPRTN
jgi:hypothetical protein